MISQCYSSISINYQLCSGQKYGFYPPKKPFHPPGLILRQISTNPGELLPLGPSPQAGEWEGLAWIWGIWSHQVGMICSSLKSLRSSCEEKKQPGLPTHPVLNPWLKQAEGHPCPQSSPFPQGDAGWKLEPPPAGMGSVSHHGQGGWTG